MQLVVVRPKAKSRLISALPSEAEFLAETKDELNREERSGYVKVTWRSHELSV